MIFHLNSTSGHYYMKRTATHVRWRKAGPLMASGRRARRDDLGGFGAEALRNFCTNVPKFSPQVKISIYSFPEKGSSHPLWTLCSSIAFGTLKSVNIRLPRKQEFEERFTLETKGLPNSEQPEVIVHDRFREIGWYISLNSQVSDGIFCCVIVPGYPIFFEKSK